jgi:NADPH-dependent glutamate synthase beta subunit-like oxidoreductase/NAD(P)H-flavin reductase
MSDIKDFPLGIGGFHFSDLYNTARLKDLHDEYWKFALQAAPNFKERFDTLGNGTLTPPQESEILIDGARYLGEFIGKLFQITNHTGRIKTETNELSPVFRFKKDFLNIRVFKRFVEPPVDDKQFEEVRNRTQRVLSHEPPTGRADEEMRTAEIVVFLVDAEKKLKTGPLSPTEQQRVQNLCSHIAGAGLPEKIQAALQSFEDWAVQTWVDEKRRDTVKDWLSFVRAGKLDYDHLVHVERPNSDLPEAMQGPASHLRPRDGFKLTDRRMTPKQVLREIDYCILCHQREKDSCSHGFAEKTGGFKKNPLGINLEGCPLDERISEMHMLRKQGEAIGSLAMIMLDNPMCPGTGHRICNDCMKGCIFQKQEPVNIPQNETGVLTEVLNLPYGFEIYSLLTRFNPINRKRPYALPYNGNDIMVVGLGPSGYTLSHYLANEGFGVVGIDALKLEPVDAVLTGKGRAFPKPIQNFSELRKELDERVLMGFGGVSEYGITVRWDKNFLAVIYLTLLRRRNLKFYGGVRFGGTLNLDDAWDLGFKHVAIATGAGRPTIINMKNNLIRGIRKASDFLMALQLTGAFKRQSMANLQVRLPAVVIGGGLTAVDTATELLAYYPIQVEKALERFELLSREYGEDAVWQMCDEEEREILKTYLEHGLAVRQERDRAEKEKRNPDFITMCREWGGVSLAYRKRMVDSPAYRLNHEEVTKALEEGIGFIENMNPVEAHRDKYGAVEAITFKRESGDKVRLSARSVMVAAGTSPNTIYEREFPGTFQLDDRKNYFRKFKAEKNEEGRWDLHEVEGRSREAFFLSYNKNEKFVTFYGDNHPDFAGNVVKAMASAKRGAPYVAKLFWNDILAAEKGAGADIARFDKMTTFLDEALVPRVVKVVRLAPTIVEVIVKARYASRKFEPGQFYRLQNYETSSHTIESSRLALEALALTGAWVDKEKDLLSMIVLEMGGSSRLCSILEPGDPVVVMGPTGTPSEIPKNQNVMLVGGGLGNAVLLSISKAMRENGCKVVYFAGYKKPDDIFKQKEIEEVTDQVIWAVDSGRIAARRPQDGEFTGNIVQAMVAYAKGEIINPPMVPLKTVDHIIAIGSDRMMAAVTEARHGVLKPFLKSEHVGIASINSSMQCMMKEVCAQCLQRHIDPVTKEETGFVFSCYNQDQHMDCVDFKNLNERLKMNSVSEKLTNRYVDYLFQVGKIERV